jgi:hypothetical protein
MGSGAGVGGEDARLGRGGLHVGEEPALEIEVLRNRLDDHVGAMKPGEVRGPAHPREHLLPARAGRADACD